MRKISVPLDNYLPFHIACALFACAHKLIVCIFLLPRTRDANDAPERVRALYACVCTRFAADH